MPPHRSATITDGRLCISVAITPPQLVVDRVRSWPGRIVSHRVVHHCLVQIHGFVCILYHRCYLCETVLSLHRCTCLHGLRPTSPLIITFEAFDGRITTLCVGVTLRVVLPFLLGIVLRGPTATTATKEAPLDGCLRLELRFMFTIVNSRSCSFECLG